MSEIEDIRTDKRGHLVAEPNVVPSVLRRSGWRSCLACSRARSWVYTRARLGDATVYDLDDVADRYYREIMNVQVAEYVGGPMDGMTESVPGFVETTGWPSTGEYYTWAGDLTRSGNRRFVLNPGAQS